MTFMQIMNMRTRFEEIIKDFSMDSKSDIDTIEWFIENGFRSNSLRNGFEEAMTIAKTIKEYADGCTEEIRTRECI